VGLFETADFDGDWLKRVTRVRIRVSVSVRVVDY